MPTFQLKTNPMLTTQWYITNMKWFWEFIFSFFFFKWHFSRSVWEFLTDGDTVLPSLHGKWKKKNEEKIIKIGTSIKTKNSIHRPNYITFVWRLNHTALMPNFHRFLFKKSISFVLRYTLFYVSRFFNCCLCHRYTYLGRNTNEHGNIWNHWTVNERLKR